MEGTALARLRALWLAHRRALMVFLLAFAGLAVLSGKQILRTSGNPHFLYMADGWLDGRVALADKPPGYRERAYDDWAVVRTLELLDGSEVRGLPCSTAECKRERSTVQRWWIIGQGWVELDRRDIVSRKDTWYVSFPPGPAAVMLPFVAVFGLRTPDILLTLLAGALVPLVLVRLLDRERGTDAGKGREHLWAAAAWTFGSPAALLAANGRVWFTAQIFGALFLALYLSAGWRARRPALAGLWLAIAIACRPINHLPAIVVFLWFWWRQGRDRRALVAFFAPLVIVGIAVAWLNTVRFGDPFEFGHRFLDVRWQARMQEHGMFALRYLQRNLECLLWLMPTWQSGMPWLRVSIHGTALWLGSPWIVLAALARERFDGRAVLWLAALGSAIPSLFYQNSGQIQFSYRFAVDWLPLVLVAIAMGGGLRRRVLAPLLVVIAIAVQCWGAWYFARAPRKLFVEDPMGWPFQDEIDPPARRG
ncbi:MAG TPA: hypothetical protein VFG69_13615 [Nannocystaceae bacterium]|nr:hypothetical protein [Nannocystaceae bacterium]